MKKSTKPSISETVLQEIKRGRVTMRPRVYFALLSAASLVAIAASALTLAYAMSLLFFWLRIITADTMAWGARANLAEVTTSFPWWALLLGVAAFAVAVWLVKQRGHIYRYKTSAVIAVLVLGALLLGALLSAFGISSPQHTGSGRFQPGHQQNVRLK